MKALKSFLMFSLSFCVLNLASAMSWKKYARPEEELLELQGQAESFCKKSNDGMYSLNEFPGFTEKMSPDYTREFIQSAINAVGKVGGTLLFPQGHLFQISIPEGNLPGYKHVGGNGIEIPSNITIDFNGSTILCCPNDFWCYNLISIPSHSENVCIKNGTVIGDRDMHVIPSDVEESRRSHEWNYGILIKGNGCSLKNLRISDFRGDGIAISAEGNWNHTQPIKASSFTKIEKSGRTQLASPRLTISNYRNFECLYIKPAFERRDVDWDFNHNFSVRYFSRDNNCISEEQVRIMESLNPPDNALYFEFSFETKQPEKVCDFWITSYNHCDRTLVESCEVYNCGRNGISTDVVTECTIKDTYIHDIGGTNNYVGIDIEGTSFLSGNLLVDRCRIERTYAGASLVSAQGANIIVKDSKMETITGHEGMTILNCQLSEIYISSPQKKMYASDNIYPRNRVDGCIVNGPVSVWNCDVLNSSMTSAQSKYITTKYLDYSGDYNSSFQTCSIAAEEQTMGPGLYKECDIASKSGPLNLISTFECPIIFEKCKISASRIARSTMVSFTPFVSFTSCDVTVFGDMFSISTNKLENNTFRIEGNTIPKSICPEQGKVSISNNLFILNRDFYTKLITIDCSETDTVSICDNSFVFKKPIINSPVVYCLTRETRKSVFLRNSYTADSGYKNGCSIEKHPGLVEKK